MYLHSLVSRKDVVATSSIALSLTWIWLFRKDGGPSQPFGEPDLCTEEITGGSSETGQQGLRAAPDKSWLPLPAWGGKPDGPVGCTAPPLMGADSV